MIGIIIQLILSWIILHVIQRQDLSSLGLFPLKKRLIQLLIGFLFAGILCTLAELLNSKIIHLSWKLNSNLTYMSMLNFLWWNIKSVLFEELIFRGALLYIAIKKLGSKKGVILSAICFGIYHWFSYGAFGNIVSMAIIFLITGFMGLVWALAFLKSKSMALPIGLHLGWNFVTNSIFSKGPLGNQILIPVKGLAYSELSGIPSLVLFLIRNIAVSTLTYLLLKYYFKREDDVV